MTNTADISENVGDFLDKQLGIRMYMICGLINNRALARYIIKNGKIDASVDAVMSTIRRYDLEHSEKIFENAFKIMAKTATISTKSPIAVISLIKDTEIQKLLPKLFSLINYDRGDVLRIIQADEAIKIFIDEKKLEEIKNIFPEGKIIQINEKLAEINVHMHPDAFKTPGLLAIASNLLAINNINILEELSCFPEWLIFVDEKDILKAYNVLYKLCQKREK